MKALTQGAIDQIVNSSVPERLSLEERPPITDDHAAHILRLIQMGQTPLAADHLLFPEMNGILPKIVGGFVRKLNLEFYAPIPSRSNKEESLPRKIRFQQYAYEALIEMALNFYGLESRWLLETEKVESLGYILALLEEWESLERKEGACSIAEAVIKKWLAKMKRVQKGNSMVAQTAVRIEGGLDLKKNVLVNFLRSAEKEIKGNVYYRMVKEKRCRFGNDYALGLRWLRHLGYEQVSTNPVLAARAYQDEPALSEIFCEEVKRHPHFRKWSGKPSIYAEEITLYATLLALWDNLQVFRPIFFNLRETSGGGVVSFQLNPNVAHLFDESLRDVFAAFDTASKQMDLYDRYLLAGYRMDGERGRPNMVIKVAATTPVARTITRTINSFGFGSNITVDYSVSQEATLILEELEGMAKAIRKGIRPTQLYMTNMGGRLESHLREVKLEELFEELRRRIGEEKATEKIVKLSEANGTKDKVLKATTYEEKVRAATRFVHGQKRMDEPIFEALKEVASKESLQAWEDVIGKSGTLVARRVWWIFFSEANRDRWAAYLMKTYDLSREQAHFILDRIHYLPASKRKPFDTYWTLSSRNLVHTEFPDHQENVRKMSEAAQFNLEEYRESISHTFPEGVLEQLIQMEDFQKAYEINPELAGRFKEVGISEEMGLRGLTPSEWPQFGPVQKTLAEFKNAYDQFQVEIVSLIKKTRSIQKKKKR
ncbi:MAG: hypothetical protein ACUVWO_00785 [Thermodesulfobacteriota bacterium]